MIDLLERYMGLYIRASEDGDIALSYASNVISIFSVSFRAAEKATFKAVTKDYAYADLVFTQVQKNVNAT